ncbi:MAG: DUF433 domain-containing protein [Halobacteriales archaeon]|jgi:uncharacterized protein (DUF433 family)
MSQRVAPIVSDPDVLDGEPRIEGRRISVRHVVELVEDAAVDASTVADRYDLDVADVYAALTYYHSHPEVMSSVERRIRERERDALDHDAVSLEELRDDE